MKRLSYILAIFLVLISFSNGIAGQFLGGKGFYHANSAKLVPIGSSVLDAYLRVYAVSDATENLSNISLAGVWSYGLSNHIELGLSQVLYQDLNYTDMEGEQEEAMVPGNLVGKVKFGNYRLGEKFHWGAMPMVRYRVGKWQDVQFEPYTSEAIELEFMMLGTYTHKPLMPDLGFSMHFNGGFIYYNDQSTEEDSDAISATAAIGLLFPLENLSVDIGLEAYGLFYIQRPIEGILGREDWAYVTPFVRTKFFGSLRYYFGLDVLVLGQDDTTVPSYGADFQEFPNYSLWRFTTRLEYALSYNTVRAAGGEVIGTPTVGASGSRSSARPMPTYTPGAATNMYRWNVDAGTGTVNAVDMDLERIRMERKKAEKELERLKMQLREKQR